MRRCAAVLFLAGLLLSAGACRKQPEGAVKVVVIGSQPKLVDPASGPLSFSDETLLENVAQGLVRFDATGKKTSNALFVLVKLNGKTIHENVQAPKPTGSEIDSKEVAKAPIMLQGDHGPIAFRNVWVKPVAMRGEK